MSSRHVIVEGIDRLGKDTLITNLKHHLGARPVLHYQKPELLDVYLSQARTALGETASEIELKRHAQLIYQQRSFYSMFGVLNNTVPVILNRAHLGECVYAHRYRGYDGSYVLGTEAMFIDELNYTFHVRTLLVLLYTDDFSFVKDDGASFDFSAKQEEQVDFMAAFDRSRIQRKLLLKVNKGAEFRSQKELASEVLEALK